MPVHVAIVLLTTVLGLAASAAAAEYDLVLVGGRVMDPESGLDAVRSVGIRDGRVVAALIEVRWRRQTLALRLAVAH